MPATIVTISPPVAATAQLAAMSGQGDAAASAELPGNSANPFAALFQQLLGKHAATEQDPAALIAAAPVELQADPLLEAPADLNALLPFMEAMGLARSDAETDETDLLANAVTEDPTDIPLAAAVTPQVQTGPDSAISAGARGTGSAERVDVSLTQESALSNPASDTQNKPTKETAAGREFSAQLVAAVESSKEQPQAAGNTANAVQQVIAAASPRNNPVNPTANLPVTQVVGSSGWSDEVGNKVVWMANRTESRADLVLTPPEMGRVEVSLSVKGEQATANFISGNPAVREALEAALPRLREILADAGIQLNQAQVGAENPRDSARQEKSADNFGSDRTHQDDHAGRTADAGTASAGNGLKLGRGLVDVFA
jgi:flagellar hook-length control protein FliK